MGLLTNILEEKHREQRDKAMLELEKTKLILGDPRATDQMKEHMVEQALGVAGIKGKDSSPMKQMFTHLLGIGGKKDPQQQEKQKFFQTPADLPPAQSPGPLSASLPGGGGEDLERKPTGTPEQQETQRKSQQFGVTPMPTRAFKTSAEVVQEQVAAQNQIEAVKSKQAESMENLRSKHEQELQAVKAKLIEQPKLEAQERDKREKLQLDREKAQSEDQNRMMTRQQEQQRIGIEARNSQISGARLGLERGKVQADESDINSAAEALAKGDLTRLRDISSYRSDQRLKIYNRAKKMNPAFSTSKLDRQIKMEDYYATGKGANNLQSFGTFLEHAGDASDAVNSIRLSKRPIMNKPLAWWRKNMQGDPDYQSFITSLEPVRKEFEGFLLGGRALYGEDRKSAQEILSDTASPAQIQAALKRMGHVATARLNEENTRYKNLMKQDLSVNYPVSAEAEVGAKKIGTPLPYGVGATSEEAPKTADEYLKSLHAAKPQ